MPTRGLAPGGGPGAGLRGMEGELLNFCCVGGGEETALMSVSPSSLSTTLNVRAFLTNSGTPSCSFSSGESGRGSCLGVLRSWVAQGATCLSSSSPPALNFFSRFPMGWRDLAFLMISSMLSPAGSFLLDLLGAGFFLASLAFFPLGGSFANVS